MLQEDQVSIPSVQATDYHPLFSYNIEYNIPSSTHSLQSSSSTKDITHIINITLYSMTKFNKIYFLLNFCFYNYNRFLISLTIKLSSMFMFMIYVRTNGICLIQKKKLDKFLYFKEQFLVDIYVCIIYPRTQQTVCLSSSRAALCSDTYSVSINMNT